jgi:aryl-alcohol dehydrogenase-like predicted oxidoreductase
MIVCWMTPDILGRVQDLKGVAEQAGMDLTTLALAWVLHNRNVAAAIVGGSRPEQITANAAASGVALHDDLLARVDAVLDPVVERDPSKIDIFHDRP